LASIMVWIVIVAVLMALAAWGLTLLKQAHENQAGPEAGGGGGGRGGGRGAATTIGTAKAVIGSIPITVDALGTVTPLNNVMVVPRVTGELMTVDVHEGQLVRKGQRLALIDPRPYQAAVNQAAGQLGHDQALLADAQLDLKRYDTLLSQNSISSQQVDTQKYQVKQDQAALLADEGALQAAKLNLEYCTIVSPVNGLVGLRKVDPGNLIQAGQSTGLFVVTTVDPVDVVFALPEDVLPELQARLRQGAKLPVTAYDRAFTNQLAQGTFYSLDSEVDTTTGTIHAKARFANPNRALFPQQFVNVRVLVDTQNNVVTIPTSAVRHGAPGDFVYTVTPDRTAHVRVVKLGPQSGETIAILSGLNVGETVVTEGGDRLRDGGPVLLPGDRPHFGGGHGRHGGHGGQQAGQGGGEATAAAGGQGQAEGQGQGQGGWNGGHGGSSHGWNGHRHQHGADGSGDGQ
jgi:multidrug efflux system membrane fusion protein